MEELLRPWDHLLEVVGVVRVAILSKVEDDHCRLKIPATI